MSASACEHASNNGERAASLVTRGSSAHAADRARSQSKIAVLSDPPVRLAGRPRKEVITMGKPSKAALSKAGRKLASDSSSKSTKSKAGSTLGKG